MVRFHNTLSGEVEEFQPLAPPQVRIYTCGPLAFGRGDVYNLP